MSATSVIGLQWGDEAKGKIVDLLADEHEIVVRYQGGNNAGHTVVFDGQTFKLSGLPVGILHEDVTSVIAAGVVINPQELLKELDDVIKRKGDVEGRLLLSDRAHVIFPWHIAEEAALERDPRSAIGTTLRGIGMCYRDKAGRTHAIRMGDMYQNSAFRGRLADIVAFKNNLLGSLDPGLGPLDAEAVYREYSEYAERLRPYVADTNSYLLRAVDEGKRILFEGAQGSMLDVDHGTYPFVTSSNSSGCGVHSGSGVSERVIDRMIGVVKAYTTRVGSGPFPTELHDAVGKHIRDLGNEYGTVTGRARRCGWFDAVAARYGARLSGVDCVAVTLLDVLSELDELKVCEAYELDGQRTTDFPSRIDTLARIKPIYRTLPGWKSDITATSRLEDLPGEARRYLEIIEELVGKPIQIVSVGPDRRQTIFVTS